MCKGLKGWIDEKLNDGCDVGCRDVDIRMPEKTSIETGIEWLSESTDLYWC
jgi:hypothetical protein